MNEETDPVVQLLGRIEIRQMELNEGIKRLSFKITMLAIVFLVFWFITGSTLFRIQSKLEDMDTKFTHKVNSSSTPP